MRRRAPIDPRTGKRIVDKSAELHFARDLRAVKAPPWESDFKWQLHDQRFTGSARKWELDFAWPRGLPGENGGNGAPVGVQIQGASHWLRGKGRERFSDDCLHRNALTIAGWLVLEFTPKQVRSGIAIATFEALAGGIT